MRDEVRLRVQGRVGEIDVAALQRAVSGFVDLLRGAQDVRWVVSDLKIGSLETAARPLGADRLSLDEQFEAIVAGIGDLTEGPGMPERWTDAMLDGVAALGDVAAMPGVKGVELTVGEHVPVVITHSAGVNARHALDTGHLSLGSAEGEIDRFLSRRSRREFGLVDQLTGDVVTVKFKRADEDAVRALIGKGVTVWGQLRRTPEGRKKELKMEGIELKGSDPAPSVNDVVGSLGADWTGGTSAVDWIRSQREGD